MSLAITSVKRFCLVALNINEGMIDKMCLDKQGTHSVQVIVEMILTKDEEDFIALELQTHISELATVHFLIFIIARLWYTCHTESYTTLPWIQPRNDHVRNCC